MELFNRNDPQVINNAFALTLPSFQEIYKNTTATMQTLEKAYHSIRTESSKGATTKPWETDKPLTPKEVKLLRDEEIVNGLPLSKEFKEVKTDVIVSDTIIVEPGYVGLSNKEFAEGLEQISKKHPELPQIKKIPQEVAKQTVDEYISLTEVKVDKKHPLLTAPIISVNSDKPKSKKDRVKEYYDKGLTKKEVYEEFTNSGEKIDKVYISDLFKKFDEGK